MTMVRRWGLTWWAATAILLIAVPALSRPVLFTDVLDDYAVFVLVSWSPMLLGVVIAWAVVKGFGAREQLDRRITAAMEGHPTKRELGCLALFLVGLVLFMALLSLILRMYEAQVGADLAMSISLVSRLLFLLTLPLLVMDRSGITLEGKGTAMPQIAVKATELWRWSGLFSVLIPLGLISWLIIPYAGLPEPSPLLVFLVIEFTVIAACEEIFFRGMLQTRLEMRIGRWGGIVATSVVFAMTYAVIQPYDAMSQLPSADLVYNMGLAMLTYAPASMLYGYLWACFRNIWLNVIMRIGMFLMLMPPDVQTGIS